MTADTYLALISIQFYRQVHFSSGTEQWTSGNVSSIKSNMKQGYCAIYHSASSLLLPSVTSDCSDTEVLFSESKAINDLVASLLSLHWNRAFLNRFCTRSHWVPDERQMMCKCQGSESLITWTRGESRSKPQACLIYALFPASVPGERREGRDKTLTWVIQVMPLSAAINIWLILNEKITLWSLITSGGRD